MAYRIQLSREQLDSWDLRLISEKYRIPLSRVRNFYLRNGKNISATQVYFDKLTHSLAEEGAEG